MAINNGFIIQFGNVINSSTATLPVAYSNTDYGVVMTEVPGWGGYVIRVGSRGQTSILSAADMWTGGNPSAGFFWITMGKA